MRTAISDLESQEEVGAMKKNEHFFEYVWPNPPRTTTKAQWKAVSRYLRDCRRYIEQKFNNDIRKAIQDAIIYGTGHLEIY